MLRIKHIRKQWPVGHGFFHTAEIFAPDSKKIFRYVYDCGANKSVITSAVNNYVSELGDVKPDIDMLVVSHFHFDHVSGIPDLLLKCNVKKLVIPYFDMESKVVASLALTLEGQSEWLRLNELITNPRSWLIANKSDAQIIEISSTSDGFEDQNERDDNLTEVRFPHGKMNKSNTITMNHESTAIYKVNGFNLWSFVFYVSPSINIFNSIMAQFNKISAFSSLTKDDMIDRLIDPAFITANFHTIQKVYKLAARGKENQTSLCMLSKPSVNIRRVYVKRTSSLEKILPSFFRSKRAGWLGTGDAELQASNNFKRFKSHYNAHLNDILVISIPHHGSIGNHNAGLIKIGKFSVVTANVLSHTHHPNSKVISDYAIAQGYNPRVVTKDPITEIIENISIYY